VAALDWLRDALRQSPAGALRLTEVGSAIGRAIPALRTTSYAGAGTLGALIEEAREPGLALSGPPARRWVFDATRGAPPGDLPPGVEELPEPDTTLETLPESEARAEPQPVEPQPFEPEPFEPESFEPEPGEPKPGEDAPEPEAVAGPPPEGPSHDALMAEAAQLVRDLLWGSRDAKNWAQDLPNFSPAEIGFVLGAIAARQPLEPAGYMPAAAAIAAEGATHGLHVSSREVTAVLRWLVRGYARLSDAPAPDAAPRLARTLYATLLNAVRAVGEKLSEAEKDSLRAWAETALSEGEAPPSPPEPPPP